MPTPTKADATDGDALQTSLKRLEHEEAKLQGAVAPGVYAYGANRPMGRIRSYSAAGLTPFAGRGAQSEFLLLGHVHVDAANLITRVEGFNGQEGERWAKAADVKLKAAPELLAPDAKITPLTPLRGCPHTGVR